MATKNDKPEYNIHYVERLDGRVDWRALDDDGQESRGTANSQEEAEQRAQSVIDAARAAHPMDQGDPSPQLLHPVMDTSGLDFEGDPEHADGATVAKNEAEKPTKKAG